MKKPSGIICIALIILFGITRQMIYAQSTATKSKFRIIGYLRTSDIENGNASKLDLHKINYLNIAFINPDENGNFTTVKGLHAVAGEQHKLGVKILASIGGGSAPAYYSSLLSTGKRDAFNKNIVKMVIDNGLDGVDVDLEGERVDSNYAAFVIGLSSALKQKGKMLTAAVATVYQSKYPDDALAAFDFINIMSYDKTGPWRPGQPGQHAPYDMAVADLDYWTNTKNIPKEKLNLGVPFYGYGFGGQAPGDISFQQITVINPGSAMRDTLNVANGTVYYNGLPTIRSKTTLALKYAGGVMIWQLLQDADGANSLLDAINATVDAAEKP